MQTFYNNNHGHRLPVNVQPGNVFAIHLYGYRRTYTVSNITKDGIHGKTENGRSETFPADCEGNVTLPLLDPKPLN